VDIAAELLERLMVITLISSRVVFALPIFPSNGLELEEDDIGIIAMMASPAWSVDEKLVSWPIRTVPDEVIFPCPIFTMGVLLICDDFCDIPSVIAFVVGGVVAVVVVACAVMPSPVYSSPVAVVVLEVLCLDFRFFFLIDFSPLKTNFPFPILVGWLFVWSLGLLCGRVIQLLELLRVNCCCKGS